MAAEYESQLGELQENILEQIYRLNLEDAYGVLKSLPKELRNDIQYVVQETYDYLEDAKDIEYEDGEREEIINKIITQIKSYNKLKIWQRQNETSAAA